MKKLLCAALAVGLLAVVTALQVGAQGTSAKVHASGKDKLVVESGGEIEFKTGSTFTIFAGGIDTAKIATDAITTAKVLNGAIDTDKLASAAVTTVKIAASAVDTSKINKVSAGVGALCEMNDGTGKFGHCTNASAAVCTCQ